jgi:GNAT superfamily N-acetyltransferase
MLTRKVFAMLERFGGSSQRPAPGRLFVTVTFLEMRQPPDRPPIDAPSGNIHIVRAEPPTVSFYRYLYNAVGEPWLWHERRTMLDSELKELLTDPEVEVQVLHVDGTPAGYAEIDRREYGRTNLSYFGLMPEFIGRHLGAWFLDQAIWLGWAGGTRRLTVNTCTFDHPRALPLYRSLGFVPYRQVTREVLDPRVQGILPRAAAPHIPIVK